MEHLGTKTLTTDRLTLRRFTMDDAEAMYNNWASDPEVTKFLTWPTHTSVEVTKSILEMWTGKYGEMNKYQWAIVLNDNGDEPIGSISVVNIHEHIQMVKIGYCIGRKWWHQGIMSEALGALIDFFFREVGVNRIEAQYDPRNPNSGKVMAKCGMIHEGTHRDGDHNNQGIYDNAIYAILARDYIL